MLRDEGEAGGEGGGVVGEACNAEAGEEAEGQVEAADEELGDGAHRAGGGDAEVGDEPEGSGLEVWGEMGYECFEFGLGEAVEEEVGGYEIVGMSGGEGEGVGVVGLEACACRRAGGVAAVLEEPEHGGAGVDCVGVELGVGAEELAKETAVSVA
jgi:hypothetical protein